MAEDLSSHYLTLHVCGQNPCQVWAWKTLLYFWARDFRTKNREEKHGTLMGPKNKGADRHTRCYRTCKVPNRNGGGSDGSDSQPVGEIEIGDGSACRRGSIYHWILGLVQKNPHRSFFPQAVQTKGNRKCALCPSRHNRPSFPQMQRKRSWDLLEPPHKSNPPLDSAGHLHLSHGMRRQTVRIR